jgi:GNAT superfamily N-acetyltransferase
VFVAVEEGRVVGWIHACVAAGSEGRHDPEKLVPRIQMLVYPRERLEVGAALVAEATAWMKGSGLRPIVATLATEGYPFYRGLLIGGEPKFPVTMPHVQLALEVAGYKVTLESIFMTAEMPEAPEEVAARVDLELTDGPAEMAHEPMRESWIGFEPMRTGAFVDGERAGGIAWVMQPHLDRLGAPCVNIWSLGVKEEHRRKGIASALVSRAMVRGYALGARFASVSTQLWNAPAHATYGKLGFRPHCIGVGRTLEDEG